MQDEAVANQEERLRNVFVQLLDRILEDREEVKVLRITFPSPEEATYRIQYRGFEDFEGGVITQAD